MPCDPKIPEFLSFKLISSGFSIPEDDGAGAVNHDAVIDMEAHTTR
jgi:hypothetical protein